MVTDESSYRRGFAHGVGAAMKLIGHAEDLAHAKELLAKARRVARGFRAEPLTVRRLMAADLVKDAMLLDMPPLPTYPVAGRAR
jgi:hypothetical protein